jgi:hypothetical protein
MSWKILCCVALAFVMANTARAGDPDEEKDKLLGGMSIVGNDEAPKSLVIVPWKSSELGDTLDLSNLLNESRAPVDPDEFGRELDYYQIRVASPAGPVKAKKE